MAEIKATTNEKVFPLKAFLGLNQNPDGDTKLKMGEAAVMNNFRITRDRNLQRRPGTKTILDFQTGKPVKGLWVGYVGGTEYMLGACDGKLYKLWDDTSGEFDMTELGTVSTDKDVHIFGFENKAYILDGAKYWQWDGTDLDEVDGYVPIVQIAVPPMDVEDKSATYENVNRLTNKRRVWLSPDGNTAHNSFRIAEKPDAIDYVTYVHNGSDVPVTYTYSDGILTITDIVGLDSPNYYEAGYHVGPETAFRSQVENMQYAELFAGTQDTRVFLYGDGTNKTIYSGIDYNGNPRADYFPDLYEALVGDENTPITGMIRHYSSLACYKSDSAWSISASSLTLAEGQNIPVFYVTPVNKAIGLAAPGQVRLVMNSPFTLFGNDCYEWKNSSYYTSNLTRDERQAKRISDRVWASLKGYETERCYCYDDNDAQEYYICYNGEALVYNYAADAWSRYTAFPVSCMANIDGALYIGTPDGKLKHFSYEWLWDDGEPIDAYWESGSMGFNQDYMRKYSAVLWVAIKPESNGEVYVTVQTDRSSTLNEKVVDTSLSTFSKANFLHWSFGVNRKPHLRRLKIKAKKFVYYKLIFKSFNAGTRATVVAADIRVRYTGMAK